MTQPNPDPYNVELGARIRQARQARRLSLEQFAVLAHERGDSFKQSIMGAYERGERAITVKRLADLAAVLGVPVISLLPGTNQDEELLARLQTIAAGPTQHPAWAISAALHDAQEALLRAAGVTDA